MIVALKPLLEKLIQYASVTPEDAGCQIYMMDYLQKLGFHCQSFDSPPVSNFFAQYGEGSPFLMFAGHTDVVASGNLNQWDTSPFILHEKEGYLFGRGIADMKGSLAAMMVAVAHFVKDYPDAPGRIGFLITSGEEGDFHHQGTPYVMEQLKKQGLCPDYCLVGEPSSVQSVGDMIKVGRRGSLNARITVSGKQGHVAYPHLADNPIHRVSPVLNALVLEKWDEGNSFFPPTSLQITGIQAGGLAHNIIPGELQIQLNIRFSTEQNAPTLQKVVHAHFERHGFCPDIQWDLSGEPFLTTEGRFLESCIKVIEQETGQTPELSTTGGTSDGRFIAPYGVEVVELGLVNASIHQVNECAAFEDVLKLSQMYYSLCKELLLKP